MRAYRTRRWLLSASGAICLLFLTATSAMAAGTEGTVTDTTRCIPTNDLLVAPFAPFIEGVSGAIGGLIEPVALVVMIIAIAAAVFTILNDRMQKWLKALIMVPAAIIIGITAIVLFRAVIGWGNTLCADLPAGAMMF